MECLLEVYIEMEVKELPNIDGPRMPHILLDIVFLIDSMPSKSIFVQMKIFIEETDYANASLIFSFLS